MISEKWDSNCRHEAIGSTDYNRVMWEYVCRSCNVEFSTEVPRGPAEEQLISCTECGSRDIGRINIIGLRDLALPA